MGAEDWPEVYEKGWADGGWNGDDLLLSHHPRANSFGTQKIDLTLGTSRKQGVGELPSKQSKGDASFSNERRSWHIFLRQMLTFNPKKRNKIFIPGWLLMVGCLEILLHFP